MAGSLSKMKAIEELGSGGHIRHAKTVSTHMQPRILTGFLYLVCMSLSHGENVRVLVIAATPAVPHFGAPGNQSSSDF